MKKSAKTGLVVLSFTGLLFVSCSKGRHECFDKKMYRTHKSDFCTMDCPGVTGCDGKFYCNECIANSNGISIIE